MIEICFHETPSGNSPVERYLGGLAAAERAMVLDVLKEVRLHGLLAPGLDRRHVDGQLWEIRVSRHRLFYVVIAGPILVLLHAYKKQSQKAPRSEIDVANARMREVLSG